MEKVKRMRTINECVKMIKEEDPDSAITYNTIRSLCLAKKIRFIRVGTRYLIDFDSLMEYL